MDQDDMDTFDDAIRDRLDAGGHVPAPAITLGGSSWLVYCADTGPSA